MWTSTRLKYLAAVPITNGLGEQGRDAGEGSIRYIRTTDVAGPRDLDETKWASLEPKLAARASVHRGDLLICAAGSLGVTYLHDSDEPACYAGYLARFRPRNGVDARFMSYWAQSRHFLDQVAMGAVRSTIDNFSAGKIRNLLVDAPHFDEQRRIADFLDAETTRLNSIISRSLKVDALAIERADALADDALLGADADFQPLRRVVGGVTVGVVVNPSTYVAPDGTVPFYRGVDVRPFALDTAKAQRILAASSQVLRKSTLRAGDLVMVRVGDPGSTAVVPNEGDGANCASLLIIRKSSGLDSDYLCHVMNSRYGRGQTRALSTGAAQLQVNASAITRFLVPMRHLAKQRDIREVLNARRSSTEALLDRNARQRLLIAERRQALITAAVTGQLDVTTARPPSP